jgi:hypothetical protein
VHGLPLAEFTLLGLLYFIKDVPGLRRAQSRHRWEPRETAMLSGTRVVLVGLGGIGRQVAATLSAAGAEVIGVGRPGRTYDVPGVTAYTADTALDEVLPTASALVLACPLTERTRGLIGPRQLALLRQGAVLVNVARGAVVDEDAMAQALTEGHLGGACLDVFGKEPLPEASPLWDLDNVLVSPHTASSVAAENSLITDLFIDNLRRWLACPAGSNVGNDRRPLPKRSTRAGAWRTRAGSGSRSGRQLRSARAHPRLAAGPAVQVVALADRRRAAARRVKRRAPPPTTRELLDDPDSAGRRGHQRRTSRSPGTPSAGKHVLCEKPVLDDTPGPPRRDGQSQGSRRRRQSGAVQARPTAAQDRTVSDREQRLRQDRGERPEPRSLAARQDDGTRAGLNTGADDHAHASRRVAATSSTCSSVMWAKSGSVRIRPAASSVTPGR